MQQSQQYAKIGRQRRVLYSTLQTSCVEQDGNKSLKYMNLKLVTLSETSMQQRIDTGLNIPLAMFHTAPQNLK